MATKAEQEARQRLASAKKALAEYDAKEAAEVKATAAATKKLARLEAGSPAAVAVIANEYVEMRLAAVMAGWGAPKTEKELLAALTRKADPVKIRTSHNGQETTPTGLARRTRLISPEDEAALRRANAKVERAKAAWTAAMIERTDLRTAAYERGVKVEPEVIAVHVARTHPVRAQAEARRYAGMDDYKRRALVDEIAQAEQHAGAAKLRDTCPCHKCSMARDDAKRKAERAAYVASLPRKRVECPTHGVRMLPVDHTDEWVGNRRFPAYPVALCDGHRLGLGDLYEQEQKAAARAAKKEAKAAA